MPCIWRWLATIAAANPSGYRNNLNPFTFKEYVNFSNYGIRLRLKQGNKNSAKERQDWACYFESMHLLMFISKVYL